MNFGNCLQRLNLMLIKRFFSKFRQDKPSVSTYTAQIILNHYLDKSRVKEILKTLQPATRDRDKQVVVISILHSGTFAEVFSLDKCKQQIQQSLANQIKVGNCEHLEDFLNLVSKCDRLGYSFLFIDFKNLRVSSMIMTDSLESPSSIYHALDLYGQC